MKYLNEGDKIFVQGSGKKPYELKKVGGVVSCSCPAWRNLGGSIDTRVCKHIKANVDPACLLPQAKGMATKPAVKEPRLTKTGKVSKAVGGVVVKDTAPPVLLAHKWEDEDPTGWWMSEKLDGVRAWWDGKQFISRLGNTYHAPDWFKKLMPKGVVLDGELWIGRGMFQKTISAVRKLIPTDSEWQDVTYVVFDAPKRAGTFEQRMKYLEGMLPTFKLGSGGSVGQVCLLEQIECENSKALKDFLKKVEGWGGEGMMLREPGSHYVEGRSKTLLKVKSFFDDEAKVIEHLPGRGKHKGRLGAIGVRWRNPETKKDIEFQIGSGFSDAQRKNPPSIGSKITFRYQELTENSVPRFPVFVTARDYE